MRERECVCVFVCTLRIGAGSIGRRCVAVLLVYMDTHALMFGCAGVIIAGAEYPDEVHMVEDSGTVVSGGEPS